MPTYVALQQWIERGKLEVESWAENDRVRELARELVEISEQSVGETAREQVANGQERHRAIGPRSESDCWPRTDGGKSPTCWNRCTGGRTSWEWWFSAMMDCALPTRARAPWGNR